eukprot:TRINITY_DN39658_c0_g1_i1.p1 TRINITY_DN39658_c0_g1~~TRINITY_DN39658_c0_g1_i1.p1  ORF type:complete len:155 (+),score=16.21 TRINITY_DN39658_c0_g1_i1:47-466(+)
MGRDGESGAERPRGSICEVDHRLSFLDSEHGTKDGKLEVDAEDADGALYVHAQHRCSTPPPRIVAFDGPPPPLQRAPIRDAVYDVKLRFQIEELSELWPPLDHDWRPSPYYASCVELSDSELTTMFENLFQRNEVSRPA